jgi:hypothetical protein
MVFDAILTNDIYLNDPSFNFRSQLWQLKLGLPITIVLWYWLKALKEKNVFFTNISD